MFFDNVTDEGFAQLINWSDGHGITRRGNKNNLVIWMEELKVQIDLSTDATVAELKQVSIAAKMELENAINKRDESTTTSR